MKKLFVAIMIGLASLTAFAEASFDEIQSLINSKQYAAAASGLEGIIQNHPKSAKAFYAMAEAQAGLGNLEKAQKALNIAKGIDPTLKFVSEGSVRSLEQAITPQTAKITYEEPSHFWRNLLIVLVLAGAGYGIYLFLNRKRDDEDEGPISSGGKPSSPGPITPTPKRETVASPVVRPAYQGPTRSTYSTPAPATPAPASSSTPAYQPTPTHTTTVVNNSSNDMLTGVLIGNMISNSGHHHETTRVVEREVVRETPKRSSWDDDSSSSSSRSSRSSSWDDDSSSKRSSSWDDDSSSRKSSSWSSSSDSSSSSSWDSGSSSSDSSSSSSWD